MSTLYYTTAWFQDAQPPAYTSVETVNCVSAKPEFSSKHVVQNAFSGPLDSSTRQQHMDQATMFMSATTDSADESSSWWDIVGTDGDWRSGTEGIDSGSTVGTNGHCTSPESEGSWMSSSTDVAAQPTLLWNPSLRPQTNSGVGMYPEQVLTPQMSAIDCFSDRDAIGGLPSMAVPLQFPAPATGANALIPKPPARKKRASSSSGAQAAVHSAQVQSAASPAAQRPPKHLASDGTCCPFCKATFAGGEAGAIPSQEQGSSMKQVNGSKVGEEIRQRCFRNRKDARQHNRQGKWWSSVGYDGEPYCQRCSEIFRDHIIRKMSNSANCTREHPCHDCEQILRCFTGGREIAFQKMEDRQSKCAPGHNGPYKRRKREQRA